MQGKNLRFQILSVLILSLTLGCANTNPAPSQASPKVTAYKTLKTLHNAYLNIYSALGEAN